MADLRAADGAALQAELGKGVAALAAGRPADAFAHFAAALACDPLSAKAHNGMGVALEALGRPAQAVTVYERALALDGGDWEAHSNLANALVAEGRAAEALSRYDAALALNPDAIEPRYGRATVLQALGRNEEAVAEFRLVLAAAPNHAEAHNNLGIALHSLHRPAEAVEHYRKAVTLKPTLPDPYCNLGTVLMEAGSIPAAAAAYRAAIALAPRKASFHFNLARVHDFAPGDAEIAAMERLAEESATLPESERVALHFALAKAYDDTDRPERAIEQMRAGNELQRSRIHYDEAATLEMMARIQGVFDRALMRRLAGAGDPSPLPIFVVGMPRSGTSLVEQIIASHPGVHGAGELYQVEDMIAAIAGFPEVAADLGGAAFAELGRRYLAKLPRTSPGIARVTDKMPWNFRHLGLIHLMLPNARIVHLVRDPLATCLSCFSKLFNRHQEFSYDLGELGRYFRAYRRMMAHWREVLPEGVMLDVSYETLVGDLDGEGRRLLAHCGLPWDDACLAFHKTPRMVRTASAAQVRRPLYRDAVERWERYRPFVAPLLEALGDDA